MLLLVCCNLLLTMVQPCLDNNLCVTLNIAKDKECMYLKRSLTNAWISLHGLISIVILRFLLQAFCKMGSMKLDVLLELCMRILFKSVALLTSSSRGSKNSSWTLSWPSLLCHTVPLALGVGEEERWKPLMAHPLFGPNSKPTCWTYGAMSATYSLQRVSNIVLDNEYFSIELASSIGQQRQLKFCHMLQAQGD